MVYRPLGASAMPPVVKNLLIINGLVFFATLAPPLQAFLFEWFALWPAGAPDVVQTPYGLSAVPDFWPWQLITTAFLHGGFGHILFNMFALWIFGMRIENIWGSRRFGIYYFVCVLGASLAQLAVVSLTGGIYPTVGASGGVLGVLLAFGVMFPDEPIYLYFFIPIPAKYLVIGYALLDLFAGISGTQAGVANFAHLGGMATGFLLIQYWRGKLPIKPARRRSAY